MMGDIIKHMEAENFTRTFKNKEEARKFIKEHNYDGCFVIKTTKDSVEVKCVKKVETVPDV